MAKKKAPRFKQSARTPSARQKEKDKLSKTALPSAPKEKSGSSKDNPSPTKTAKKAARKLKSKSARKKAVAKLAKSTTKRNAKKRAGAASKGTSSTKKSSRVTKRKAAKKQVKAPKASGRRVGRGLFGGNRK